MLGTHLIYISSSYVDHVCRVGHFACKADEVQGSTQYIWHLRELLRVEPATGLLCIGYCVPGTLQAVLIIAVGVLTRPLFDRGYIRSLMIFDSFMVVFGMMMLSLSSKHHQIILSKGLYVGVGSGII